MVRKAVRSVVAVLVAAYLGVVVTPGCVIKLGKGTGPDETGGAGGSSNEGGAGGENTQGGLTPEEQEELASVDPQEFVFRSGVAAYAASGTESLVELQIADPENIDPETLQALIDQYAPQAIDDALLWASTVDPSVIPAVEGGPIIDFGCQVEPHLCPQRVECNYQESQIGCYVTHCGTGKCPWCPFGGNLVFKSWCSYGCIKGGNVVMGAFVLRTVFNNYTPPFCINF